MTTYSFSAKKLKGISMSEERSITVAQSERGCFVEFCQEISDNTGGRLKINRLRVKPDVVNAISEIILKDHVLGEIPQEELPGFEQFVLCTTDDDGKPVGMKSWRTMELAHKSLQISSATMTTDVRNKGFASGQVQFKPNGRTYKWTIVAMPQSLREIQDIF